MHVGVTFRDNKIGCFEENERGLTTHYSLHKQRIIEFLESNFG